MLSDCAEYGIDILKVQEIRGYEVVTRIVNAPEFIKGVVSLRGIIVAIVDMPIKFNVGTPTYDQFTVVIILTIGGRVMAIVVDSVSDVITLTAEQVKPAPKMGSAFDTDYLIGLGTLDERMLILIDIDTLMLSDEMGADGKCSSMKKRGCYLDRSGTGNSSNDLVGKYGRDSTVENASITASCQQQVIRFYAP